MTFYGMGFALETIAQKTGHRLIGMVRFLLSLGKRKS
jgi:hypothetical protein